MLRPQHSAPDGQRLFLQLARARQVALCPCSVRARLFIEVSVSGCSGPSTRRGCRATSSCSLRAPAKSPCARRVSCQIVHRGERIRVLGPQHPAADGQRLFLQLARPRQVALRSQRLRQVVHRGERIRVLGPQHPAADGERLFLQLARPRQVPLCSQRLAPGCSSR